MNCIKILNQNIIYIENLVKRIYMGTLVMSQLEPTPSFFKDMPEVKEYFKEDKDFNNKIYEIGFVYLIASFESFMQDLIKELLEKDSSKIPSNRIEKIRKKLSNKISFVNQEDFDNYVIDTYSIEKSFNLNTWSKSLLQDFGIKIFDDVKDKQMINSMSIFRNAILHAGGHRNSKFFFDSFNIFPELFSENQKFTTGEVMTEYDKLFNYTLIVLRSFIIKIEKKFI